MAFALELEKILAIVGPSTVTGEGPAVFTGVASLSEAGSADVSFLGNDKYRAQVATSRAGAIFLPLDYEGVPQPGQIYIRLEKPSSALAAVCRVIEGLLWPNPRAGVHASAVVAADAVLGAGVHIGPLAVVESGASIGAGTVLEARAYVGRNASVGADCRLGVGTTVGDYCQLGNRVRLQPGAVIGSDGFGYETVAGAHIKVPQVGYVMLEDDVEIGANSTVDRARFSVTRVGRGTKVDNLVQIAHNVVIGSHCIIVAQAGIAGSSTLEDYVVLGGQAAVSGHLRIGKGVRVGGQSAIIADVEPGAVLLDSPAIPFGKAMRIIALKHRLPDLFKKVDHLEKQLAQCAQSPSEQ